MQWSSSEGDKDVEQNLGFYNRVPKKKKWCKGGFTWFNKTFRHILIGWGDVALNFLVHSSSNSMCKCLMNIICEIKLGGDFAIRCCKKQRLCLMSLWILCSCSVVSKNN